MVDGLVELLLLLDACRRGRAERITAVVSYVGHAREDRRDQPGEAVGARAVTVRATSLVGVAVARLDGLPLRRLVVTDTLPAPPGSPTWLDVRSVAPVPAEALQRLQGNQPPGGAG